MAAPEHFGAFFDQVTRTCLERVSFRELTALLVFLDYCFNSMEVELVRRQVQRLVSLPMWICLLEVRWKTEGWLVCPVGLMTARLATTNENIGGKQGRYECL